jgi:cytochrome c peroxidase
MLSVPGMACQRHAQCRVTQVADAGMHHGPEPLWQDVMDAMKNVFLSRLGMAGIVFLLACVEQPMAPARDLSLTVDMTLSTVEAVGKVIFFDENLSIHRNQSCAACHDPAWGFTGPDPAINAGGSVYEGSIPGRFGDRRPPTSAYATPSPILHLDKGLWIGGNFWDGRATGDKLGNPAADQAQGPFVNPAEQALRDPACVVQRVSVAAYASAYASVSGNDIFTIQFPPTIDADCSTEGAWIPLGATDRAKVNLEYDRIALLIAAYEASPDVNAFTSKFDAWRKGQAKLTKEEQRGFALFQGKAKCVRCHSTSGQQPLFTDFSYDNLGVPVNPLNPAYLATGFLDPGLGGFLGDPAELGKMKVPTLRNVDRRPYPAAPKSYMHNGVFKSLDEVVHFYNTRDVLALCAGPADPGFGTTCWPAPEIAANVNTAELGDLGLSFADEQAIVAFMKTLTDGYWRKD